MLDPHGATPQTDHLRQDVHGCMHVDEDAEPMRFRSLPLRLRELQANDRARMKHCSRRLRRPICKCVFSQHSVGCGRRKYGFVQRAEIGASAQEITPTLAAGLGLSRDWGVIIADVVAGGPG